MELQNKNFLPLLLSLSVITVTSVACSSSAPPPAPVTKSADGDYDTRSSKSLSSESGNGDELEDESDDEELAKSSFDFGGAEIGDKEVVEAVKSCHEKGRFYDRFDEDEALGKCTTLELAQVSCTAKDLRKLLSTKQKEQFNAALKDSYEDWEIDQCLDCEKGADEDFCMNNSGKEQVGIKVFFVKDENDQISGKTMVLPVRPKS